MGSSVPLWFRWVASLAALGVLVVLVPTYAALLLPPAAEAPRDFFQEWSSARSWFDGQPVYSHLGEFIERTGVYQKKPTEELLLQYNAHPPGSVLLVLPLGALDYRSALLVWHGVSLLALIGALAVLLAESRLTVPPWLWLPVLVLLLLCTPISKQFQLGQLNAVLLLPLVLA